MEYLHGGNIYQYKPEFDYSANINPLGIPDSIKTAIQGAISKLTNYPDSTCKELREAISKMEQVPMEYIVCGNGAADLIFSFVLAVKPKKALLLAPTFAEYEQALRTVGCQIQYYYLKEKWNFELTKEYLRCINKELDVIFLCSPNNPTGKVIDPELLLQIVEKCRKEQVLVVVDECFNDFLEKSEYYTIKNEIEKNDHVVVLKAFTKMFAIPGIRLGYALTSNVMLIQKINEVRQPWSVSILAQEAGVAATKEIEFVQRTKDYVRKEREYLYKQFQRIGIAYYTSEANYILLKCGDNLFELLLKEKILIRDCSNYEGLEKGYYRVAIRTHHENKVLIDRINTCMGFES